MIRRELLLHWSLRLSRGCICWLRICLRLLIRCLSQYWRISWWIHREESRLIVEMGWLILTPILSCTWWPRWVILISCLRCLYELPSSISQSQSPGLQNNSSPKSWCEKNQTKNKRNPNSSSTSPGTKRKSNASRTTSSAPSPIPKPTSSTTRTSSKNSTSPKLSQLKFRTQWKKTRLPR